MQWVNALSFQFWEDGFKQEMCKSVWRANIFGLVLFAHIMQEPNQVKGPVDFLFKKSMETETLIILYKSFMCITAYR